MVKRLSKSLLQKKFLVPVVIAALAMVALSSVAISSSTFYSFSLSVPQEVTARPGETVTVDGGVTVTGWYWLHNFDLSLDGLPYEYSVNPEHWQDVRILRQWNPQQGVYREPENFTITIDVPSDASGMHIVTVTGQEHQSWRETSNSTFFVLKVEGGAVATVNESEKAIQVSDILVPETVEENEPFNITFRVENKGSEKTAVAISVIAPEDWTVAQKTQYLDIAANDSAAGIFRLTPTASAGTVSLYLEYPYKQEIINFTREGPYLQPVSTTTTLPTTGTTEPKPYIVELYESFKARLMEIFGTDSALAPVTIGVIVVLVIIIVWLVTGIIKDFRSGVGTGRKSEDIKMQGELGTTEPNVFNGIDTL